MLIAAVVIQVLDFILGKCPLLHSRKIPVERFDVYSEVVFIVDNHCHIFLRMGDADIGCAIFQIGLAVVVMVEIHLLVEKLVDESPHGQFLFALRFAAEETDFLHLVGGY